MIHPVILSGGSGTRLWPLSRAGRPKQFLALGAGGGSLLADTAARISDPGLFHPPLAVCGAAHADMVAEALAEHGATLLVEPAARNTAPAIALAAHALPPDALMLVLPSDHVIGDVAAFHAAVRAGVPLADTGWLVTFGMEAGRPETGYGYIALGEEIAPGVRRALAFVEKPDRETAERYVADGGHVWNAGIFLMRADAFLAALARHAPDIAAAAGAAMAGAARTGARIDPDAAAFADAPARSIDHAVMEKAGRVAVVPAAIGWSDVGNWEAIADLMPADAAGNRIAGPALAEESGGCLIRSDGPLVLAAGVENLVIVATGDAVLVMPRGDGQRIRRAVEALRKAKGDEWL